MKKLLISSLLLLGTSACESSFNTKCQEEMVRNAPNRQLGAKWACNLFEKMVERGTLTEDDVFQGIKRSKIR